MFAKIANVKTPVMTRRATENRLEMEPANAECCLGMRVLTLVMTTSPFFLAATALAFAAGARGSRPFDAAFKHVPVFVRRR